MEKSNIFSETIGNLIRSARIEKNLSVEELAKKIRVTDIYLKDIESDVIYPTQEDLKMLSGNLGIPYRKLRGVTGYTSIGYHPNYYTANGEAIDTDEILSKIYYKDPSILSKLYEIVFPNENN